MVFAIAERRRRAAGLGAGARPGGRSRGRWHVPSMQAPSGGRPSSARAVAAGHGDACPPPAWRSPTSSSSGSGAASLPVRVAPMLRDHLVHRLEACGRRSSASTCGSAAAIPPTCGEKPAAATRGLTHTIRYASRASRSISRADQRGVAALPAVGQDHDHGPARHPAAAVAVVEGLERLADAGAGGPVGRGGGGALDGALRGARGERARDPRQAASRTRTPRRRGRAHVEELQERGRTAPSSG